MGVAGSGKTTVGRALAGKMGAPFFDADDFHSESNRSKMARGLPLNDEDREVWLQSLSTLILKWNAQVPLALLACSALKQTYRTFLEKDAEVGWIYLKGSRDLIAARLAQRKNHFFNPVLLDTQFKDLEEPLNAWVVNVSADTDTIVSGLMDHLKEINVLRR
jgi:carbohydrate kinase (thermoresistant glucokinase family)